jgi:uncharacterized protein (DUF433 family)
MKFSRITIDPRQMNGVPCIRGLRIPVATVVERVADGMTRQEILNAYPDLKTKDVEEALRYAALAGREGELLLRNGVPILPKGTGARIVTPEVVNRLRDEPQP